LEVPPIDTLQYSYMIIYLRGLLQKVKAQLGQRAIFYDTLLDFAHQNRPLGVLHDRVRSGPRFTIWLFSLGVVSSLIWSSFVCVCRNIAHYTSFRILREK